MGVNLACFVRYFLRSTTKSWTDFAFPLLGFAICGFIWLHLGIAAKIAGSLWIGAGLIYGAIRTRGFRQDLVRFESSVDEA